MQKPFASLTPRQPPTPSPEQHALLAAREDHEDGAMSDDKKRDVTIEMGERSTNGHFEAKPVPPQTLGAHASNPITQNPLVSIMAYCGSSILMTVTNKYVLSGTNFNLNFFLLAVQVSLAKEEENHKIRELIEYNTEHRLYRRDSDLQTVGHHHIPRLQHGRGEEMVPDFRSHGRHVVHLHQGASIHVHPRLHHFQELDHYPDRIW